MNSRTSLFSKMLIKSDLKRFWWVSALNTLAILIFAIYSRFERYLRGYAYSYLPENETVFVNSPIYYSLMICIPILIAFCGFTAIMISLYLNSANTVSFMHGLPLKRKTHFASHYLSGIILVIAPVIVNAVIVFFMRLNPALSNYVTVMHILKWVFCYIVYALVVYSGTTFVTLLTGNAFAAIGVTGCIAVLPLIVTGFLTVFFQENLYGYYGSKIYNWLQYIYIEPRMLLNEHCLIYIALIVVLVIGAYFIYKIRHLENNGEVIAFPKLKPVFIYTVAIILGFLGYLYCTSISSNSSMWWILVFGLLGVVIAFMLSKKAFTLKGSLKPLVIYTCFFAILFCVMKFDLTGYEKRIPDISKIEGVTVAEEGFDWDDGTFYTPEFGDVRYLETYHPVLTNDEDIENIIALHKYLIENREWDSTTRYMSLPICYKLTNGSEICRIYSVPRLACKDYLKKIYETEEMKAYDFKITDKTQSEIIRIRVSDSRFEAKSMEFFENDKELLNRISEAFKKDIENLKYEDNYNRNIFVTDGFTRITFEYFKPVKALSGQQLTEEQMKQLSRRYTYVINENYVNTMAILNEKGFFEPLPKKESITAVGISFYDETPATTGELTVSKAEPSYTEVVPLKEIDSRLSEFQHKITNPDEAWALYELATNEAIYDTNYGFHHVNLGFVIDDGIWQCTLMYNENMPEILKKISDNTQD